MLDIVGIGPDAENTYESLLARGRGTLDQLASDTELAPDRLRTALQTLEEHGVVRRIESPPAQYSAVDHGIAKSFVDHRRRPHPGAGGVCRGTAPMRSSTRRHRPLAGDDLDQLGRDRLERRGVIAQRAASDSVLTRSGSARGATDSR